MSENGTTPAQVITESRSSVTIKQRANGQPQVEVKVYEGTTEAQLDLLLERAAHTYERAVGRVSPTYRSAA